ncbi:Rod shape-determining protein MreC [hydrothermal vent metagenome]|uniref:Rod shape-determining protein MreC n=1 Tax=hydrothermal vent metagenome TaxID=652676 RepID=A0A1W1EAZ8_9ZZZZ
MKTRIIIIIILLLILGVLLTRNDERITNTLLSIINPIKQNYKALTQELEDKGHSYLFQKESIEKLTKENRILRKRLLEQTHYIRQVKDIYSVLPHLTKLPVKSISLTSTISYIKLNSFSRIILTKPKQIHSNHIYGLIQKSVVAGIALLHNNQLYGYLTSDEQCRFTVFVGKEKAPGIAIGVKNHTMIVKFIPKWHKIKKGDKVVTSGLDDIFFANLPVGIVTKVDTQSAFKVAYIKTYADIFHPKIFFLINNAAPTLTEGFDANTTDIPLCIPRHETAIFKSNTTDASTLSIEENNTISTPAISSIPQRIDQTQEETIEPEVPQEQHQEPKPTPKPYQKRHKSIRAVPQTLDLF